MELRKFQAGSTASQGKHAHTYQKKDEPEFEEEVIVIDCGSGFIKAGFSGEDAPRICIPTLLGEQTGHDPRVGYEALQAYAAGLDDLTLRRPIERCDMHDMDSMKKIWEYVYRTLNVDSDKYPVMLTVAPPVQPTVSRITREKIAEIFFLHFRVPALCMYNAAVLSLFASGRTRGLVLELGEGATYAVPVFEGFALPHASARLELAGQDLTYQLIKSLNSSLVTASYDNPDADTHPPMFTDASTDTVRDIKEKLLSVLPEADDDPAALMPGQAQQELYELPDGQTITVSAESRNQTAELLFRPHHTDAHRTNISSIVASSSNNVTFSALPTHFSVSSHNATDPIPMKGVHELAFEAVLKCDNYLQRDLFCNIVLGGGTSMLTGFGERLNNEMERLDQSGQHRIDVVQDSQRRHSAWIGGSMFASLSTFVLAKVTRQEYDECIQIIHKKFF